MFPEDSFRAFSPAVERIAADWFENPVSGVPWQFVEKFGGTESQPYRVKNDDLVGLAKPGVRHGDTHARAAHEKLASDLAYALRLPVPPVVLWDPGEAAAERRACISAWAFQQCESWDRASGAGLIADTLKASAARVGSAMVAFDTWVSATDRKSEHVLVNMASTDQLGLAFIDYSFSLSYVWDAENHGAGLVAAYLPVPIEHGALRHMAERIQKFDLGELDRLVGRIPDSYLLAGQRAVILNNLSFRSRSIDRLLSLT